MTKKWIDTYLKSHVFFLLFFSISVIAQPSVCPLVNADMTPTCAEACIICDIDGYTGTHSSNVNGELPADFCTFFVHNAQWIAFQAASENLTIELTVSNCDLGVGLEMAIYQSFDCENFQMVSNCLGGMGGIVGEGESGIFTNTEPLVIGQYYYLAMDGGMGDNCDWTLNVLSGSTELAPIASAGEVLGDSFVCINSPQTYSVDPSIGVTQYEWFVNGISVDAMANTSLDYTFGQSGVYEICVVASNVCSVSPPSCKTIMVGEETTVEKRDTICQGDVYNFGGTPLTTAGNYSLVLTSIYGCDSTTILNLSVQAIRIDTTFYSLCEGDTLLTQQHIITASGIYIDTLSTTQNCDSIVIYDVILLEKKSTTITILNCENDPFELNGVFYFQDTIISVGLLTNTGCDSIVNYDILYKKISRDTLHFELCEGDTLFTQQQFITASGIYVDTLATAQNCDSIVIYDVILLEKKSTTITILNCENDPFELNGVFYFQDTIISVGLLTNTGCDSIVNYNISFKNNSIDTIHIEFCDGDTLFTQQHIVTASGIYIDTLSTSQNCDSIVIYDVILLENKSTTITIFICENDPFELNGVFYFQDTIISVGLLTNAGCDSIVKYNLSFKPKTRDTLYLVLCQDDTIMVNAIEIDEPGIYLDTLINSQGCDSILTIIASEQICMIDWKQWVDQIDCFGQNTGQISITVQNGELPIICSIENTIAGINKTELLFNYVDTITFRSLPSGTYNIRLKDQNGNDTLTIVNILERPKLSVKATISNFNGYAVSCHNYNDGFITIDINGGTPPYNLKWSTGSADTLLSDLYAGNYEGLITDSLNCIQNISYQLKEPDSLYLRLAISENDCEQNASLSLVNPNGGVPPYTLSINGTDLGGDGNSITLQPGQYNIIVLDNNGCEITDDFSLENAIDCEVLIPNIFSPNGNGTNDYFIVFVSEKFRGSFQSLKIYDRWGNLVYSINEFMPNENLWDGTFLGKAVEQGVYTYMIEYTIDAIGKKVISGDITVMR